MIYLPEGFCVYVCTLLGTQQNTKNLLETQNGNKITK